MTTEQPQGTWLGTTGNSLAELTSLILSVFALAHAEASGDIELVAQHSMEQKRPRLLSSAEATEAYRRSLIGPDTFAQFLARDGHSRGNIDVMRELATALADPNLLAEAARRGLIDEGEFDRRLRLLGYDPATAGLLKKLRFYIPTAQDVVSFANRDVYYPDVVEAYGMAQDFPEAMIPDMERAGMDRETALKYWEAHWQLPSMNLAFEMLQRDAETGLTPADINRLMRSAGIEPYWRQKILAVSYSPFTRVDIRRMHKAGILSREQVVRAYRDIGYNAERAEQLTQFTEKLNGTVHDDELAPFRNRMRGHAETLYEQGLIDTEELHTHLTEMGYSDGEASGYAREAEFIREARARAAIRQAVRQHYERGDILETEARSRLATLGDDDAAIQRQIAEWTPIRELTAESHHATAQRELTKSDVLAAYEDAIISKADALSHLHDLRYSDADAAMEIALADHRQAKADRQKAETVQHALYMARRTDNAAARKGLTEEGVAPERVEKLITEWTAELEARTPTLTKAEVAHAIVNELLTPDEGYARLHAMGYSSRDASIIVALANKGQVIA